MQPRRRELQQLVANLVTMKIIYALEMIEVEHGDSKFLPRAAIARQGLLETVLEQFAAGGAGQRILLRPPYQIVLTTVELRKNVLERMVEGGHHEDDRDARRERDRQDGRE